MRKFRSLLSALLISTMVFTLCACGVRVENTEESTSLTEEDVKESADVSIPPDPSEDRSDIVILNWDEYVNRPRGIQEGTVLNYVARYDIPSQLPWNCVSEGWLLGNIYEGLLYMYMNDPEDIRGCLAESWEHSEDYLTWSFQIRDGVMFTDGTACDAPAIAKAWEYMGQMLPANMTDCNIASWEAVNTRELVVHLSAPCAWLEQTLSGNALLVVSPTALDLHGINSNRSAVGTGPYYIDSYTSGERIVLKANPDYRLEEKMPCIETVNFRFVFAQDDIVSALLTGDVDGAAINHIGNSEDHSASSYQYLLENGYSGNLTSCSGYVDTLWLNANVAPVFQTFEVRKAIDRFIDFNAVNDELYDGMGRIQDSLWARGSSGYVPTDQYYYNPDEGQALLASAGVAASDIKFEVFIYESQEDLFTLIQSDLGKSGIDMTYDIVRLEDSVLPNWNENAIFAGTSFNYSNSTPYIPWSYILKPDALIKLCWQDIYNPELYQTMLDEYDAMTRAATWEDMLAHCKQLTSYEQDDFGAIAGVQAPAFLALGKAFKNGIYFSENHWLQLYYLYQQNDGESQDERSPGRDEQ